MPIPTDATINIGGTPKLRLNKADTLAFAGLSHQTMYREIRLGRFPRSRRISRNRSMWLAYELLIWQENLPYSPISGKRWVPPTDDNNNESATA